MNIQSSRRTFSSAGCQEPRAPMTKPKTLHCFPRPKKNCFSPSYLSSFRCSASRRASALLSKGQETSIINTFLSSSIYNYIKAETRIGSTNLLICCNRSTLNGVNDVVYYAILSIFILLQFQIYR